jgi:hypothetical protein
MVRPHDGDLVAAAISVAPVAAGRLDDWRVSHAGLSAPRRIEWAQTLRNRGITRQAIFLAEDGDRHLSVIHSEAAELPGGDDRLDAWFSGYMSDLHDAPFATEVVCDASSKPGPWKGWRG